MIKKSQLLIIALILSSFLNADSIDDLLDDALEETKPEEKQEKPKTKAEPDRKPQRHSKQDRERQQMLRLAEQVRKADEIRINQLLETAGDAIIFDEFTSVKSVDEVVAKRGQPGVIFSGEFEVRRHKSDKKFFVCIQKKDVVKKLTSILGDDKSKATWHLYYPPKLPDSTASRMNTFASKVLITDVDTDSKKPLIKAMILGVRDRAGKTYEWVDPSISAFLRNGDLVDFEYAFKSGNYADGDLTLQFESGKVKIGPMKEKRAEKIMKKLKNGMAVHLTSLDKLERLNFNGNFYMSRAQNAR